MLWPSTGAATSCLSLSWGNNETTRARDRPGSKLWPSTGRGFAPSPICTIMLWSSTGAATSCLSPIGVIMRLPGRGIALVSKLRPSTGEGLCPVPHLYDNATAIDGSSHFVPVPHWGNNETTRARDRPGSRLWPSTGEGLRPVPHLYDNASPICTIIIPHLYDNVSIIYSVPDYNRCLQSTRIQYINIKQKA